MPSGNVEQPPALGGLSHEEERREPALGRAAAQPAQLLVRRMDDDPVTHRDAVDLAAGPLDHAGHLVAESHGSPGDASHMDEGDIGAADPARRGADEGIAGARVCRREIVEADVIGAVHPNLSHPPGPLPRPHFHSPAHGSAVCRAAAPRVG